MTERFLGLRKVMRSSEKCLRQHLIDLRIRCLRKPVGDQDPCSVRAALHAGVRAMRSAFSRGPRRFPFEFALEAVPPGQEIALLHPLAEQSPCILAPAVPGPLEDFQKVPCAVHHDTPVHKILLNLREKPQKDFLPPGFPVGVLRRYRQVHQKRCLNALADHPDRSRELPAVVGKAACETVTEPFIAGGIAVKSVYGLPLHGRDIGCIENSHGDPPFSARVGRMRFLQSIRRLYPEIETLR